jgi:hypothetical protein
MPDLSHIKTEKVQHEAREPQYKAWRIQRPNVFGYGITPDAAIEDLRFCVQPDRDGKWERVKPQVGLIGGNMRPREEIIAHNKARFGE